MGTTAIQFSHLIQIRPGFGGYTFEGLHILNDEPTNGLDFGQVGTVLPYCDDTREDQALSPDRVKTCGLGVYTGYLSTSDEAMGEILSYSHFPGLCGKNSQVPIER